MQTLWKQIKNIITERWRDFFGLIIIKIDSRAIKVDCSKIYQVPW